MIRKAETFRSLHRNVVLNKYVPHIIYSLYTLIPLIYSIYRIPYTVYTIVYLYLPKLHIHLLPILYYTRFILRTAMRTRSKLAFGEASIRRYCFKQWKNYCLFYLRMDRLEDLIEKCQYKHMFIYWKKLTKQSAIKLTSLVAEYSRAKVKDALKTSRSGAETVRRRSETARSILSMRSRPTTPSVRSSVSEVQMYDTYDEGEGAEVESEDRSIVYYNIPSAPTSPTSSTPRPFSQDPYQQGMLPPIKNTNSYSPGSRYTSASTASSPFFPTANPNTGTGGGGPDSLSRDRGCIRGGAGRAGIGEAAFDEEVD